MRVFFPVFFFVGRERERERERGGEHKKNRTPSVFINCPFVLSTISKSMIFFNKKRKTAEGYTRRKRTEGRTRRERKVLIIYPLERDRGKMKKRFSYSRALAPSPAGPCSPYSHSAFSNSPLLYASIITSHPPKKFPEMYTCGKVGQDCV